jgi:multidrug resistance efflux pump
MHLGAALLQHPLPIGPCMLAEAEQNVRQLKASLDQAAAATERANAQFALAQQNYDRQSELFQRKVIAQATLDTFTRSLETARQSLVGAKAEEERARLAFHPTSRASIPRSHALVVPGGFAAQRRKQ